ncbi:hypothetical protein [Streptomyces sp. CC210A]|uniref:hypothetical protein n=1 Tax=Streptomyces sp. CC210A TaxID=2898184 RepID=UPI001F2674FD|nr:hypothetical protein [Streptomyces sp. CC210A]
MSLLPPHTFATYFRGLDLATVTGAFAEAGLPARTAGDTSGWAWVTHDAGSTPVGGRVQELAQQLTGFRYADRVLGPGPAESVFLASTPPCTCPHGQHYSVPQCDEHPIQFMYSRDGFGETYFNVGRRRETRRCGDLLVRELLEAGIVGRDTPGYDADPDFNADGARTLRLIATRFELPPLLSA